LARHPWTGNVRELAHDVERAILMSGGDQICRSDLGLEASQEGDGKIEDMSLEDEERYRIRKALDRCDGNDKQAGDALGLSRSAFYRWLQKL
jgi:transcriptional regulator of acetoin/glycerol metabolism